MHKILFLQVFICAWAQSSELIILLTHDSDSKHHIEVKRLVAGNDTRYSFRFCEAKETEGCVKMGRHESYSEKDLQALENSYWSLAQIVFSIEATTIVTFSLGLTYYAWRNPAFVSEVNKRVSEMESATESEGANAMMRQTAMMRMQPAQAQKGPGIVSTFWSAVAGAVATAYNTVLKPVGIATLWHLKGDIIFFCESMGKLIVRLLSPAESGRAATLLHEILRADSSLSFGKREYASISEYGTSYSLENMQELKTKVEDVLAAVLVN